MAVSDLVGQAVRADSGVSRSNRRCSAAATPTQAQTQDHRGWRQAVKECCCPRTGDGKPGAREAEYTRSPTDGVRSDGTLPPARRRADLPAGAARPLETRHGRPRHPELGSRCRETAPWAGEESAAGWSAGACGGADGPSSDSAGGRAKPMLGSGPIPSGRPPGALSIRACQGQRPEPSSMRAGTRQGIRRNLPFRLPAQAAGRPQPGSDVRVASRQHGPAQAR